MTQTAPSAVVAAPPLRPPRYGLIQAARDATADAGGERWEGGFGWDAESCSTGAAAVACDTTPDLLLDPDDMPGAQAYTPFLVWDGHVCSAFGPTQEQREAKARRQLAVSQHRQVESEFWRGDLAQAESWDNPYLAAAATDLAPGDTSPLVYGLAALEEALAGCTGQGLIHVTTTTHTLLVAAQAVRLDGNLWISPNGHIVVPGSGYDGSDPDGDVDATGATAWAYATSAVDVRLGTVLVSGGEASMQHRQNLLEVRAERPAAANFDPCCVFGIQVDLCRTFCDPDA